MISLPQWRPSMYSMLVLIFYQPQMDGKLSELQRERRSHRYSRGQGLNLGPPGWEAEILPLCQPLRSDINQGSRIRGLMFQYPHPWHVLHEDADVLFCLFNPKIHHDSLVSKFFQQFHLGLESFDFLQNGAE